MATSDSQVVVSLLNAGLVASVHASVDPVRGLGVATLSQGECRSFSDNPCQQDVAGVKSQDSLLPGEVVC